MIILTGGAGFIGSCFLRKLNNEGINDVLVVDHLGAGNKWKNLSNKKFVDFVNKDQFPEKLKSGYYQGDIDAIIHLGACSSTTETDADYLIQNNYNYSKFLAEYAADNNIKFIYASSAATYGDGSNGYEDKEYLSLQPLNAYGFSKHIFDLWVLENQLENQFVGLKFFNVFGPNEYHKEEMSSMIYKSYFQIINTGKIKLFKSNDSKYGNGEQKRDFIYVKDAIQIMWQLLNDKSISGIFNLGTGHSRSWNNLANAVAASLNLDSQIEYIDIPVEITKQYQNFTEANMNKLIQAGIDYKFPSLEENVNDYIVQYLSKNQSIY